MENTIILDGKPITLEQFNEHKNSLSENKRIIETSPNTYETVERLQG